MTHDVLDRIKQRSDLTCALEEHFGPGRGWPLHIRAVFGQLDYLRDVVGDVIYAKFLTSAEEGIRRRRESVGRTYPYTDYLGRELLKAETAESKAAIDVIWGLVFGLTVMLSDDEYERLVRAASAAWAASNMTPSV